MPARDILGIGTVNFPDTMSAEEVEKAVGTIKKTRGVDIPADNPYVALVIEEAKKRDIDPHLALRIVNKESRFNPDAVSHAGARGLMQLMPKTASGLGVTDPHDPVQNVRGGLDYLKTMLDANKGDVPRALAAYNWGPGNLAKHGMEKMPAETQDYISVIHGAAPKKPRSIDAVEPSINAQAVAAATTPATPLGGTPVEASRGSASGVISPTHTPSAASAFGSGLGNAYYRTARAFGLPQALRAAFPDTFRDPKEIAGEYEKGATGFMGGLGDFAGSVQQAIPLAVGGAAMLPQAMSKAHPYIASALVNSGVTGAMTPGDIGDRAKAGAISAAVGAPLQLAGRTIAQPLKQSPEAEVFQARTGEIPPVSAGAESRSVRDVGSLSKGIPVAGSRMEAGERRMTDSVVDKLWERAVPPNTGLTNVRGQLPNELFRPSRDLAMLNRQSDAAYGHFLRPVQVPVSPADALQMNTIASNNLAGAELQQVARFLHNELPFHGQAPGVMQGTAWKELRNKMQERAAEAFKAGGTEAANLGRTYRDMAKHLDNMLERSAGPDVVQSVRGVDRAYAYQKLLLEAAGAPGAERGISPAILGRALQARHGTDTIALGKGTGQDLIDPLTAMLNKQNSPSFQSVMSAAKRLGGLTIPGIAATGHPGGALLLPAAASAANIIGAGSGGAKMMFGQTAPQRYLAELLRPPGSPVSSSAILPYLEN